MESCGQAVHAYDEESTATIHLAIELGCTFLDTAEVYGPFTNEELLGRSLKGRRDQVTIATKFGFALTGNERHGLNSRPDHIKASAGSRHWIWVAMLIGSSGRTGMFASMARTTTSLSSKSVASQR
jgi:hypothetical protein